MRREEAIHALRGLLAFGRERAIEIQGTSMEPFLKAGDLVQVEAVSPSRLGIGDLIAFLQGGSLIVHRFVGRVDRSGIRFLRQKGDNLSGHGLVQPEALVGRVVWVERGMERRFLLHGKGLAWNRIRGYRVWGVCFAREMAGWERRQFQRKGGPAMPEREAKGTDPSREQEILILASRLELSAAQEARLGVLLGEGLQWSSLLGQGTHFGLLPLLQHHFSRPSLETMVPEEAREALAKAYRRTSLKNLRMLGLLRRFLLKAHEAGVEVILLKGAYLAKWVYGDVGLRPMSDLDLLCHKEDEPSIWKILEGMGGFRSNMLTEREPDLSPVRVSVNEKILHSAPWWFPDICRIEVHYHLLSQSIVDDAWLQEALWSKAAVHDWDGLQVRSLDPEHLMIHLASHLHRHLQEQSFNMYWFADVREVLCLHRGVLNHPGLISEARRLGLEEDCASVFRLIGEPWGGEPGQEDQEAARDISALMDIALQAAAANSKKRTVSGYLSIIWAVRHVNGFFDKARYLRDLLFPPAWKLAREYRTTTRSIIPLLYLAHPFNRLLQGLRGTIQNVQRRLGH